MSYKFGQLRKSQIDSYMKSLDYTFEDIETRSLLSQGVVFTDKAIVLSEDSFLQSIDNIGKSIKSYYLRIKVNKKIDSKQLITIKLINTNKEKDNEQTLETVTVEEGNDYSIFDFVIAPNQSYNQIHFILNRILEDYNIENPDGTYGRKIEMEITKLKEIYNVIDFLNPLIENKNQLKQIGVQGNTGMLMSINGEAIRIGRSGIYEINNGVSIKYIGFVIENEDNEYFLLDYQY